MFRKRIKKTFPPGTFISTPARVFAILQLCIVFSILLWHASQPFMGELFAVKSKMLVFQNVMGHVRFQSLPEGEQASLIKAYGELQKQLEQPYLHKLKRSLSAVLLEIPPLELAWLFFSIILSIMLLKRVVGVSQVLWVLPLLAAAYALDNRMYGYPPRLTEEQKLFPSEALLVEKFLGEPLSKNVFEQQEQLKKGWDAYLVQEWTKGQGTPEEGLFAFNFERAQKLTLPPPRKRQTQESLYFMALILFWNFSYAWIVRKTVYPEDKQQCPQSS